jgi:inhibitor of KinA
MQDEVHYIACGDAALRVDFGSKPTAALTHRIAGLKRALQSRNPPGLVEAVPGLNSLTILFDPDALASGDLRGIVAECLSVASGEPAPARTTVVPVCYEPDFAPDLQEVAQACGLGPQEVVRAHAGRDYTVYVVGFSPGWGYLGDIDTRLVLPRRPNPRQRVPAGSVAIASNFTGVYPQETPGGWHLIGRTPLRFFDAACNPPALLAAGETVRFRAVDRPDYERIAAEVQAGTYQPETAP